MAEKNFPSPETLKFKAHFCFSSTDTWSAVVEATIGTGNSQRGVRRVLFGCVIFSANWLMESEVQQRPKRSTPAHSGRLPAPSITCGFSPIAHCFVADRGNGFA